MEIRFFNRYQGDRFSIEKVTSSIISQVAEMNDVVSYEVPNIRADFKGLVKNIKFVFNHRTKKGINHVTGDIHYCILGLIGCKSVLTVHDTVFLTVKQNKISYFIKWLLWLYLPCLLADKVICISEKTKNELANHHVPISKVVVIYDPVSLSKVSEGKIERDRVQILHVGTKPNKNLNRVIESLKGLNCYLTIIGKLDETQTALLMKSGINYKNLVGLSEEELAFEYISSDIVSFPSLYEGFGMPIIEGQLAGCAVLTSDISPMTEVGMDSVLYVNPNDIDSIREGFKLLIENEQLRDELIEKGKKNAKRFSPNKIAANYIEVYRHLIEEGF